MSKARAKGTGWESELLPLLRQVFGPQVERAPLKGIQDKGDFTGVPFLIEAKKTDVPHFLQWAKTNSKKADRWWTVWAGDRRRGDGPFVMMPLAHALEIVGELLSPEDVEAMLSPYITGTQPTPYAFDPIRGSLVQTDKDGFVIESLEEL